MPSSMINTVIIFEKDKADDQFFVQTGFEEEDVDFNVKKHELEKDEAYTKMIKEAEAKSSTFLADRAKEQEMMREQA